ncbi:hypothetical protein L7F22_037856 [Adiantum nelumboides]|nr:hypothetical protein [Adiantum nelumboides]
MMDESLGGVVDGRFRVHGIDGLRVVDASVVPYALSSHLAAEVYALAEVAADLIKHDHRSAETGDGDEGGDEGDDDDDEDCDDGEDEGEDEEEECDDE